MELGTGDPSQSSFEEAPLTPSDPCNVCCRSGGVSVQDPFSEGSDPAFQKRGPVPPSAGPFQQGVSGDAAMRMGYDGNKDPFVGPRKGG